MFIELFVTAFLGLVSILVGLLILSPFRWESSKKYAMLQNLPGPKLYPIVGAVFEFLLPHEKLLPKILEMHHEYGPIFKMWILGNSVVFLSDPNDIEVMLSTTEHISKSLAYNFLHPWLGTGLLTSTGKKWHIRRKLLTPTFHFKILDDFVQVFNAQSELLVERLKSQVNYVIDINANITLCTLDIICETAMGTSVNAQTGGDVEYIRAVKRMGELFQHRHLTYLLHNEFIFQMSPTGREQKSVLKVLHGFSEKVIKERRAEYRENCIKRKGNFEPPRKRLTFLDLLIEISETEGVLTDKDIREEVDTFMFEGHDTTAAGISWAVFLLGHNPHVQDKVICELDAIFGEDDRQPSMADLQKMTYLDRVIKEVLRLYPSVPVISRKLESDFKIRDVTIPAGTNIPMTLFYLHRNPQVFPDPETFDPDRFLPEKIEGRHPFAYLPFSAGPRNCIGQKFARLEEKAVLSGILRNFKITSLDNREDIKLMMEMILRPKEGLRIKLTPRF